MTHSLNSKQNKYENTIHIYRWSTYFKMYDMGPATLFTVNKNAEKFTYKCGKIYMFVELGCNRISFMVV